MKTKLSLLVILLGTQLFAQDFSAILKNGQDLYQTGEYGKALNIYNNVLAQTNEQYLAWQGAARCELMLKDFTSAKTHFTNAYWLENGEPKSLQGLAFLELLENDNLQNAKAYVKMAVGVWSSSDELTAFKVDCDKVKSAFSETRTDQLYAYAKERFAATGSGKKMVKLNEDFFAAIDMLGKGKASSAEDALNIILADMLKMDPPLEDNYVEVCNYLVNAFEYYGYWETANKYAKLGYNLIENKNLNTPFYRNLLVNNIGKTYNYYGESEKTLALTSKNINGVVENPAKSVFGDFLVIRLAAYGIKYTNATALNEKKDYISESETLYDLSANIKNRPEYYKCHALINLMAIYITTEQSSTRNKGFNYGEQAKTIALENDYIGLLNTISGNLAISYFQNGQHEKARKVSIEIAEKEQELGDWSNANITLTNLGAMYLYDNQLSQAVEPLQKAIEITESLRSTVPIESRMEFINLESNSYSFLNQVLARLNRSEELYKSLEQSRARVLADRLKTGGLALPTIAWVQSKLKKDEAVLMFGVTEPGAVAVCVITKNAIKSVYHHDQNFISNLKSHFAQSYQIALNIDKNRTGIFNPFEAEGLSEIGEVTNVMRKLLQDSKSTMGVEANVKADLLNAFYDYLIKPINPYLTGINKLVICPDNYLGFIPFEALVDENGKYLIENYDVRYVPSMSIWKEIEGREYANTRKNMIAFGGATFAPYAAAAPLAQDQYSFQQLIVNVNQAVADKTSQRNNYAALGVVGKSWGYLPGTLTEVEKISEIVKGVEIFKGADFSESNIKKWSREGTLKNYKVVHLATHGMVVPTLPELSTIVATLDLTETNGEDGYLNQVEIAELNLNADFVALSACETGLGKIYNGEGISGLMQSLILAGANGMSVSLWAVSDQGTMYFMTGLYDLVFNQNYAYADAMNTMKRKFINGDYGETYQHPNYWAPYVYYGK